MRGRVSLLCLGLLLLCGCGAPAPWTLAAVDGAAGTDLVLTVEGRTTLDRLLPERHESVTLYTAGGEIIDAPPERVELLEGGRARIDGRAHAGLAGVLLNPPGASNRDVCARALGALADGERVMVIYLDGLGWQSYQYALDRGLVPRLAELEAERAAGVFPTITPVNYAAMVTGRTPAETGVRERGDHDLDCGTLFDGAVGMGKSVFLAEGDAQMLNFSVPQELNVDLDGDGDTDGEVFASAMEHTTDTDLLFVHFHGIDDTGHAHGPLSQAHLDKIAQTDAWVGELLSAWDGAVIVTADHGQHRNDGGGDGPYADKRGVHGSFAASDLLVPLLTRVKSEE